MKLDEVKNRLQKNKIENRVSEMDPLPANFRLKNKNQFEPRISAVLILLFEKFGKTYSVLTQRHTYNGSHSGQVSLPGGKKENSDADLKHTAIRETEEEIGITQDKIKIIEALNEIYIPPSNFLVQPYVGFLTEEQQFIPDPYEVKEIIKFPVSRLLEVDVIKKTDIEIEGKSSMRANYFDIENKIVWGATAMILEDFKKRLA